MEFQTWMLAEGYWKGQFVSPIVKGSSREEVIKKLKEMINGNNHLPTAYTSLEQWNDYDTFINIDKPGKTT